MQPASAPQAAAQHLGHARHRQEQAGRAAPFRAPAVRWGARLIETKPSTTSAAPTACGAVGSAASTIHLLGSTSSELAGVGGDRGMESKEQVTIGPHSRMAGHGGEGGRSRPDLSIHA